MIANMKQINEGRPHRPCGRVLREGDNPDKCCPICGSGTRRKWVFWGTGKCINPDCKNYYMRSQIVTEWLEVDPQVLEKLAELDHKTYGSVEITLFLSPYDLPDAVRGRFDPHIKKFVIEFRYIQHEEWQVINTDEPGNPIALRIGRNSGRLYGIEVDVNKAKANAVAHTIRTINYMLDFIINQPDFKRKDNFNVAKKLLNSKCDSIFSTGLN